MVAEKPPPGRVWIWRGETGWHVRQADGSERVCSFIMGKGDVWRTIIDPIIGVELAVEEWAEARLADLR
jgi:hypothetical protein